MTADDPLTALLHEAVEDVEPADRLGDLRARTQARPRRGRWYAGGAVLATAAAVTAVAVVGGSGGPRAEDPGPAAPTGSTAAPTAGPDPAPTGPTGPTDPTGRGPVVAVYQIGPGPDGPDAPDEVLYRSFEPAPPDGRAPGLGLLAAPPSDPDYRTAWAPGDLVSARVDPGGDVISVVVGDPALRSRPASMTAREAVLAVQQVVLTLQASVGERLPVQFRLGENPVDQVLGVPTSEPVTDGGFDVLSLMSLSDPFEGQRVSGTFIARGVASSFEASVYWTLSRDGVVVRDGSVTAAGWLDEELHPWESRPIDVSGLEPGPYVLRAITDDPTAGTEGRGSDSDTRTVVVEQVRRP